MDTCQTDFLLGSTLTNIFIWHHKSPIFSFLSLTKQVQFIIFIFSIQQNQNIKVKNFLLSFSSLIFCSFIQNELNKIPEKKDFMRILSFSNGTTEKIIMWKVITSIILLTTCSAEECTITNCFKCSIPTVCLFCSDGFFLENSRCEPCSIIDEHCQVCQSRSLCLECSQGRALISDTQCRECGEGESVHSDGQSCAQCTNIDNNCIQCLNEETCTGCEEGFALMDVGTCVACSQSQFLSEDGQQCVSCSSIHSGCQMCTNSDTCTSCSEGMALVDAQTCVQCLETQTVNFIGDTCIPCTSIHSQCFACSDQNTCSRCDRGFKLTNNACLPCSPSQTNNEEGNGCVACTTINSQCQECSSTQVCTRCVEPFVVAQIPLYCVRCAGDQTLSEDKSMCISCSSITPHCVRCSDQNTCKGCESGYSLDGEGDCSVCSDIDENCLGCWEGLCLKCKDNYAMYQGKCQRVPTGTKGVWGDGTGLMIECEGGCMKCSEPTTCVLCSTGYSLQGDNCYPCDSSCLQCEQNLIHCTSCYYGSYLRQGTCLPCWEHCLQCDATQCSRCVEGYYPHGEQCLACERECLQCSEDYCVRCAAGYGLFEGMCIECLVGCVECDGGNITNCYPCPEGFYLASNGCERCMRGCEQCTGEGSCQVCEDGFSLYDGHVCYPACRFPCLDCEQDDPTNCSACFGGYHLDDGKCVEVFTCADDCVYCPRAHILVDGICEKCSTMHCDFCSDVSTCVQCSVGYYLQQSYCQPCPDNCYDCTSPFFCTECSEGSFMIMDYDKTKTGFCYPCHQGSCLRCKKGPFLCQECHQGLELLGIKAVPLKRISFNLELNTRLDVFITGVREFKTQLVGMIGEEEFEYVSLVSISEGSVRVEGQLSLPDHHEEEQTYQGLKQALEQTHALGDKYEILSVEVARIGFAEPVNSTTRPSPQKTFPFYIIAIILLALIGIFIIIHVCLVERPKEMHKQVENILSSKSELRDVQIFPQ